MAIITATKTGNHYRLEIDGHAGTHDACVMISALLYALVGSIHNNDTVTVHYEDLNPGHAVVEFLTDDPTGEEDMRCVLIGMMQVQFTYPDAEITISQNIFETVTV